MKFTFLFPTSRNHGNPLKFSCPENLNILVNYSGGVTRALHGTSSSRHSTRTNECHDQGPRPTGWSQPNAHSDLVCKRPTRHETPLRTLNTHAELKGNRRCKWGATTLLDNIPWGIFPWPCRLRRRFCNTCKSWIRSRRTWRGNEGMSPGFDNLDQLEILSRVWYPVERGKRPREDW